MKILAISDVSAGGGAGQLFKRTNTILTEAGHQVVSFTEDTIKTTAARSAVVNAFRQNNDGSLRKRLTRRLVQQVVWAGRSVQRVYYPAGRDKLLDMLSLEQFDVVHVHNLHSRLSLQLLSVLEQVQIPVVMQVNDYFIFCNNNYAYNVTLNKPCQLCIEGNYLPSLRYKCSSHLNTANAFYDFAGRLAVHYLNPWSAIDLYLVTGDDSMRLLQTWGVPLTKQSKILNPMNLNEFAVPVSIGDELVFYGSDFLIKGTATFLQALEYVNPGTKIGVYLMRMSSQYQQRLEEVAQRRNLQLNCNSKIRWDQGLREIVANARAVIVPSQWWVPSENVVYEALLLGKPVIVSKIGGNTELVDEGETGLFFEAQNPHQLADYINKLATDRELAVKLGETAYQRSRQKFSPQTFLASIEIAYEKAIHHHMQNTKKNV